MLRLYKNIRYFLVRRWGNSSFLYYFFRLFPSMEELIIDKDTQICIEGFPRSANSFLTLFFSHWNPEVKTAHHLHLPFQVKIAAENNIPTVVIIRKPLDAIVSLIIRENFLYTWVAIKTYILFYEMIEEHLDRLVLTSFEDAISRPDSVIEKINNKFNKSFNSGFLDKQINKHLFNVIDDVNSITGKTETAVSRPSKVKEILKKDMAEKVIKHRLYDRALKLYNTFNKYE